MNTELAWAAGFYDGEGSTKKIFYHYKTKKGLPKEPNQNVTMAVTQATLEPLQRFHAAVGGKGRINGPYQYKSNRRPYWVWSANCISADEVFALLQPFLCSIKKQQYETVKLEVTCNKTRKKGWIHDAKA